MKFINKIESSVIVKIFVFVFGIQEIANNCKVYAQRTILDELLGQFYRQTLDLVERSGDIPKYIQLQHDLGKTQKSYVPKNVTKLCNSLSDPERRSSQRPLSVHRLRPGDIDIIGAIGDSLTAGTAIFASNLLQTFVENRGASWSIGGQYTWREYLTLPNILKEFNSNLYGYSLKDGLTAERTSKFNVAAPISMSRELFHQANILIKRIQHDDRVNMLNDWKMVTLFIGVNDVCSDMCYYQNPEMVIEWHEQDLLKTFRYLRDNLPRLIINLVPVPNMLYVRRFSGIPKTCYNTLLFECACLTSKRSKSYLDYYENIMKRWIAKDYEVAARDEFNTDNFTINVQPVLQFKDFPRASDGNTDTSLLTVECFHWTQKMNAVVANGLWNNMLELPGEKSIMDSTPFKRFLCPSKKHPYIITRVNSRNDFRV